PPPPPPNFPPQGPARPPRPPPSPPQPPPSPPLLPPPPPSPSPPPPAPPPPPGCLRVTARTGKLYSDYVLLDSGNMTVGTYDSRNIKLDLSMTQYFVAGESIGMDLYPQTPTTTHGLSCFC
ncbi:hypothetical protein Vretimale_14905, partial [Volvox reticuliferus]